MNRFSRVALGGLVAIGMLAAVPGAAFAANPSCGDVLMASRTLSGDLDCSAYAGDALTLGKKGITLNLNGYTLTGPAGDDNYSGVYSAKKNVTVRNGTIENYDIGVYFYGVVGGTIKGLDVMGEAGDANDTGIYVYYGTTNTIHNNDVSGNQYGIDVEYAAGNWITNNDVWGGPGGNPYDAFYLTYETGDHVSGNTATDYDDTGFYDEYSGHQTYTSNWADGNDDVDAYGFYLNCGEYGWLHLLNNTAVHNGDYGFYTYECFDYYSPYEDEHSIYTGNRALDNGDDAYGWYDYWSINAWMANNVVKRSGLVGFYLDYPSYITFKNNVANRNGSDGIYSDYNNDGYGNFKVFNNNTANNNDEYGIYLEYGFAPASGNVSLNNGTAPDNCWNVDCN
jgi:parallel beta-helix repeat protein